MNQPNDLSPPNREPDLSAPNKRWGKRIGAVIILALVALAIAALLDNREPVE